MAPELVVFVVQIKQTAASAASTKVCRLVFLGDFTGRQETTEADIFLLNICKNGGRRSLPH